MSSSDSLNLTQKWLRQNIATYDDRDRVFSDVDSTLSAYTTLRPKTDIYTYDDGRTQLLLCVHGLLPITYRQASYHIPIAIWVTRQYPREPPLAFVVPTSEMLVRPGKYIDVSGLCKIDYLSNWEKKSEGCDLPSLVQALQHYFSHEPPVYSKPKQQSGPSSGSRPSQVSRPPPPVPHPPPVQSPPPVGSPVASPSRPTIPPKPPSSITPVVPYALPTSVQTPHSDNHSPIHVPSPPPKPPLPPPLFSSPSQSLHSPAPPHFHNRPSSIGSPWQRPTHSVQLPEGASSSRYALPPGQLPHSPSPVSGLAPIPPPPPFPVYEHPPVPPHPPPPPPQQSTVALAPPRPNLLDEDATVEDPQPPPPAQLRTELASVSQAMTLDGERLRAQQADLLTGVPAIRDEMGRLEAVRDVCRGVATRLREAVDAAERGVAELKRKGDPPVDELVCSTSIVHNQLVDLVAEDNAIEDTIYHLHRALNAGRIDLDRFLRTTRVLAEEQFMKRALIERIQTSLPMGASVHPGWA
ncbi:UEV-domain-containing protein [Lactarius indigo]|nr:UEV-domain-containing protein [Lactarius indigo]